MIVKWIVEAIAYVVGASTAEVAALVPDVPSWVGTGLSQLASLYDHASDFGVWIPVGLALTLCGWIVTAQAFVVVAKIARMGISYATLGGGAVSE